MWKIYVQVRNGITRILVYSVEFLMKKNALNKNIKELDATIIIQRLNRFLFFFYEIVGHSLVWSISVHSRHRFLPPKTFSTQKYLDIYFSFHHHNRDHTLSLLSWRLRVRVKGVSRTSWFGVVSWSFCCRCWSFLAIEVGITHPNRLIDGFGSRIELGW